MHAHMHIYIYIYTHIDIYLHTYVCLYNTSYIIYIYIYKDKQIYRKAVIQKETFVIIPRSKQTKKEKKVCVGEQQVNAASKDRGAAA